MLHSTIRFEVEHSFQRRKKGLVLKDRSASCGQRLGVQGDTVTVSQSSESTALYLHAQCYGSHSELKCFSVDEAQLWDCCTEHTQVF